MKRAVRVCIGGVAVVVAAALLFIYSGMYNVAASVPHYHLTEWVLATTMDRSVAHHAAGIIVPDLSAPARVSAGSEYYHEMCVVCHGGPGFPRSEISQGLNPPPQDLAESANEWKPSELYWIAKYGVKMTGMPAFAPAYSEAKLWAIAAFVKRLPKMTPEEFQDTTNWAASTP